jgi:hypothetical protein
MAEAAQLKHASGRFGFDSTSEFIREAVKEKLSAGTVAHAAGKNKIEYNPKKDNFTWKVVQDNGQEKTIMEDVSADFIINLSAELKFGLDKRRELLGKTSKDSVPVPRRLLG